MQCSLLLQTASTGDAAGKQHVANQSAHKLCAGLCRSLRASFPIAKLRKSEAQVVITLSRLVKLLQISIEPCARAS